MRVLALDLGTSAVKAIVWDPINGVTAKAMAPVPTSHPHDGWAEQDPGSWWAAARSALDGIPLDGVSAIGLSSQRETFVCLDADMRPLREAILWSDGRAGSPAGRWEWLRAHEPDVAARTRWLAAPKDVVVHRLTGRLVTDATLASRTDVDASLLPDIVEPRELVGDYRGIPVVAGAGDRACEAYAVGASATAAMVSWGTTANASLPVDAPDVPRGWVGSRAIDGRVLLEAGVSAAGSALGRLATETGLPATELSRLAAAVPPGANGVIALPWYGGARAPWWRPDVDASWTGDARATPGDRARAIYEGVAHDIRRALALLSAPPTVLRLAGGGTGDPAWREVIGGVTGIATAIGAGADAGAIGAAMLAAGVDTPPHTEPPTPPEPASVAAYAELAVSHDAAAAAALGSPP